MAIGSSAACLEPSASRELAAGTTKDEIADRPGDPDGPGGLGRFRQQSHQLAVKRPLINYDK